MNMTIRRVSRGRYAIVWEETGRRIKATDGKRTELFPEIVGDEDYAWHVLDKLSNAAMRQKLELL